MSEESTKTTNAPAAQVKNILAELTARERVQVEELERTRAELAEIRALFAPASKVKAAKAPGKPRGPRKVLGNGRAEVPAEIPEPEQGHFRRV